MVALTNTWKQKEDTSPCLFRSKQDSIITGRRHNIVRGVEEFSMTESEYADNAAFLFPSREISESDTPRIMKHCAKWRMEVHSGITETPDAKGKTSKTELLFVEKTLSHRTHQSLPYNFRGRALHNSRQQILLPGINHQPRSQGIRRR